MELIFSEARIWRYLVSSISKVIEEAVLVIHPERGLRLRALDPSHVVLIDMNFPPESFDLFEVEYETDIGVNLEDLAKVLRRATKDDRLKLTVERQQLNVILKGRGERIFGLPVLDIKPEEVPEPELDFKASATLSSNVYADTLKDIKLVGEIVSFEASPEYLKVYSGSEIGEAEVLYTFESDELLSLEAEETQKSTYSLEYFTDLSSAAKVAEKITIQFSSNMPILVKHEIPYGALFSFLVAPRVE